MFYARLDGEISIGLVRFDELSDFVKEGLCAFRERQKGLAPVGVEYASDDYYNALVAARSANPDGFAKRYSETTSKVLDAYLRSKALTEGMRIAA